MSEDSHDAIEADLQEIQDKLQRLHRELKERERVDAAPEPIDAGDPVSMNPLTRVEPEDG